MRTLRVRHELAAANVALLRGLGWRVVVDPAAPACVRFAGSYSHALKPDACAKCRRLEREAA